MRWSIVVGSLFLATSIARGGAIELRQDTVDGKAVSTVNDNFRRLEQDKLDKRQVQAILDAAASSSSGGLAMGYRNRVINGDMRIDQRNAGAAVTVNSTADKFPVDRFNGTGQNADGVFTVDQTTTAPDGFRSSVVATVTTADASIGAAQNYVFRHQVEGYSVQDMGFGTSWAKEITLSFWVRSSVTGTFGGAFINNAVNRSYPFSYTISSANTWEQKTITFTADTTGTWDTTNGRGVNITWSLGSGSSSVSTANTWAGSAYSGVTGQTNLISTLNATWYITGVQLELGDIATAFEHRPIETELALCQRYFEKSYALATAPATATTIGAVTYIFPEADWEGPIFFAVTKRAAPTITFYNSNSGSSGSWRDVTSGSDKNMSTITIGEWGFSWQNTNSVTPPARLQGHWTASTEL